MRLKIMISQPTTGPRTMYGLAAALSLVAGAACAPDAPKPPAAEPAALSDSAARDALNDHEQQWADAIRTRDSVQLERLLAPGFVLTGTDTSALMVPRGAWLANTLQRLRVDTIRITPTSIDVRGDTADVALHFFWTGQFDTLPPFRDSTALTDRWIQGPTGWQVHRRTMID